MVRGLRWGRESWWVLSGVGRVGVVVGICDDVAGLVRLVPARNKRR